MADDYRQILVVRKDLNMPVGKVAAQVAHGSMKALLHNLFDSRIHKWLNGSFTKVVVGVDSEEEMRNVLQRAKEANLIAVDIVDEGRTVFDGVPTLTVIAIGPDSPDVLKPITGHLKLLR